MIFDSLSLLFRLSSTGSLLVLLAPARHPRAQPARVPARPRAASARRASAAGPMVLQVPVWAVAAPAREPVGTSSRRSRMRSESRRGACTTHHVDEADVAVLSWDTSLLLCSTHKKQGSTIYRLPTLGDDCQADRPVDCRSLTVSSSQHLGGHAAERAGRCRERRSTCQTLQPRIPVQLPWPRLK